MKATTPEKVRVRFAPSPTGFLHVGGLRTALFNYLFAKKNRGVFILRIEDTDRSREVAGALENIQEMLGAFGLAPDEGPYFQSQRLEIYQKHIDELIQKNAAYKCYCSADRIAELKKQAELAKQPFRYDKHCLKNPDEKGTTFVVRQNVTEEGFTEFTDRVYGQIKIENRLLDDGVLMKSDGYPVYNFANVVDDHLMNISHVIRGEEFIPSTPKHVLLYEAFGWTLPQFVHLPLLLDIKRQKLSKRSGDVAVKEYLEKGYLPEAIINFIAFLGWNPKTEQEFFSADELAAAFEIEKINKAGSVFDLNKLKWFNSHYIKQKSLQELAKLAISFFPPEAKDFSPEFLQKILEIERARLGYLAEIGERVGYFFKKPDFDKKLLVWKEMKDPEIKNSLVSAAEIITNLKLQISKQEIQEFFLAEIGESDKGALLWPPRVALTGLAASPGPFEILEVFFTDEKGKQEVLNRIRFAIEKL